MISNTENEAAGNTGTSGDMAVIGEGTPNRTEVSIQVLQGIYHELTGKSEDVSKTYDDAFKVVIGDIEQLHHRMNQTCEQYHIKGSNCSVKLFYLDDTQETFSSFERFRAFNSGSTSAVESVLLTYNLMIVPPKTGQVQSYTISIRLASKVAIERKMRQGMPMSMPKIFRVMTSSRTAVVSVKYVDYAIARTLLNCVDEWFKTLPKSSANGVVLFLQDYSSYIRLLTRYLALGCVFVVLFLNLSSFVGPDADGFTIVRFLLCASVGMFAAYRLADHLGSAAEDSLDAWSAVSYVQLTTGDKAAIEEAATSNRASLVFGTAKLLAAFSVSVLAKVVADLIIQRL